MAQPLPNAFVTLLTDPSYLPGALVVLHSLHTLHPAPRGFQIVCLVTPETVDARTIGALRNAGYDLVIGVEPIASGLFDKPGLDLMGRPDLNLALTKLHLFRLGSFFSTMIYLDADTLPIRPLDSLFESTEGHAFSACPDIGWPDCFNSGVMVVRPKETDFDNLREMLAAGPENQGGTFDGADQGLLNQYFSEEGLGGPWNRLPFTYNVTPSAAYQYIPAYKHYAHKISVIHFIGPRKPWSNLSNRPAGHSYSAGPAFDYASLVDRWYGVYDRFVRPSAVHEPNLVKRFTVPEHVAVWNQPIPPSSQNDRLTLGELKASVEHGVAFFHPGQYTSLPLEGRVDLIAPRQSGTVTRAAAPSADAPSRGTVVEQPPVSHDLRNQESAAAPLSETWDASRYAPPKESRPEMVIPMKTVYTPAWDEPISSQTSHFKNRQAETLPQYPILPSSVQENDWYRQFTGTVPDPHKVQAVFPWEGERMSRPKPSRVFPKEEESFAKGRASPTASDLSSAVHSRPSPHSLHPINTAGPRPAATSPASNTSTPMNFQDAMAAYTNAWDDVASIGRYANRLTLMGIGTERRSGSGLETGRPSPHVRSPRQRPSTSMPVDGGDRDDEDDGEGEAQSDNPRYLDKHAQTDRFHDHDKFSQTDRPRVSDAFVQATPERSPKTKADDDLGTGTQSSEDFLVSTQHSGTPRSSGRVWDPRTDVEMRKKDSKYVLDRFVNVGK